MENFKSNIRKSVATLTLLLLSFVVFAQSGNEYPQRTTNAEQANEYLHNIEVDPNGVPNSSAWYVQPWIWALVAAFLVLFIPFLMQNYLKRHAEDDSESGTGYF